MIAPSRLAVLRLLRGPHGRRGRGPEDLASAEQPVQCWTDAGREAEALRRQVPDGAGGNREQACRAVLAHVADHVSRVCSSLFVAPALLPEVARLAQMATTRFDPLPGAAPLAPGWLGGDLARLGAVGAPTTSGPGTDSATRCGSG